MLLIRCPSRLCHRGSKLGGSIFSHFWPLLQMINIAKKNMRWRDHLFLACGRALGAALLILWSERRKEKKKQKMKKSALTRHRRGHWKNGPKEAQFRTFYLLNQQKWHLFRQRLSWPRPRPWPPCKLSKVIFPTKLHSGAGDIVTTTFGWAGGDRRYFRPQKVGTPNAFYNKQTA